MLRQTLLDHAPDVETYLARLDRELKSLPETERDIARRELRQHMDALIAAYVETGMSDTEATHAALAQFGDARKIGGGLRREWRLSNPLSFGNDVVVATLWALAAHFATWCCAVLAYLTVPYPAFNLALGMAFCFFGPVTAGVLAETRAPKRGLQAIAWAFAANTLFTVSSMMYMCIWPFDGDKISSVIALTLPLGGCLPMGALAVGATAFLRRRRNRKRLEAGNA